MKMGNRALLLTTFTVGIVTGLILSGLAVNAVEKGGVASERESFWVHAHIYLAPN